MSKNKILSVAGLSSSVFVWPFVWPKTLCRELLVVFCLALALTSPALLAQTEVSHKPSVPSSQPSSTQRQFATANTPSAQQRQTANTPSPQNPTETGANLSQFKAEFMQATGLREGDYQRKSGPETCQEGELRLVEVDSSLSVLLGAHALVTGLGRGSFESQDADCLTQIESSFSQGQFSGTRNENCQGEKPLSIEVKVEVLPQGQLRYQRTNRQGRKVIFKENCLLQLSSP